MRPIAITTYLTAFVLTILIIVAAVFGSDYLNRRKTDELKSIANKLTIDTLALESKIDLLEKSDCTSVDQATFTRELEDLGDRLSFMERQIGFNDPDLFRLRRYYALLEIRDYMLTEAIIKQCNISIPIIVYFYTQEGCEACVRQEYVLRSLGEDRDNLHIYSFEHSLDRSAIDDLTTIELGTSTSPVLVINKKVYTGFKSVADVETILSATTTAATSSKSTPIR